jgi:hypothetical protein
VSPEFPSQPDKKKTVKDFTPTGLVEQAQRIAFDAELPRDAQAKLVGNIYTHLMRLGASDRAQADPAFKEEVADSFAKVSAIRMTVIDLH